MFSSEFICLSLFTFSLFVPLVEIFVAKEIDWVENVPTVVLESGELCILRSEHYTTGLVFFNCGHHVFLGHIDQIFFGNFKCSETQLEFLLVSAATSELNESLKRGVMHCVELLECKKF